MPRACFRGWQRKPQGIRWRPGPALGSCPDRRARPVGKGMQSRARRNRVSSGPRHRVRSMDETDDKPRLSELLGLAREGEPGAIGKVFEVAYPELCALAHARLRSRGQSHNGGLETTALVHESFLRLAQNGQLRTEHRSHFFKYAGR